MSIANAPLAQPQTPLSQFVHFVFGHDSREAGLLKLEAIRFSKWEVRLRTIVLRCAWSRGRLADCGGISGVVHAFVRRRVCSYRTSPLFLCICGVGSSTTLTYCIMASEFSTDPSAMLLDKNDEQKELQDVAPLLPIPLMDKQAVAAAVSRFSLHNASSDRPRCRLPQPPDGRMFGCGQFEHPNTACTKWKSRGVHTNAEVDCLHRLLSHSSLNTVFFVL